MSRLTDSIAAVVLAHAGMTALLCSAPVFAQDKYPGVGRSATPKEITAWDIDVRPDFKGLPKGSGSVAKGMAVWEGKCASCHGSFGESNAVFTPIIGGTTKDDIKSGHVAALRGNSQPQRTTMMKLSQVSTLWDYINRAMPWTAPKTLTTEEVYAVTAYILNMAEVLPDDFILSDRNIAEVQQRLPNRYGMTTQHGLWHVKGKADVQNSACMKNCATEIRLTSALPDYARGAHGNLAEQSRRIGPVRGVDSGTGGAERAAMAADGPALAKKHGCIACHGVHEKIVGPGFSDIHRKYQSMASAEANLSARIRDGSQGAWGDLAMPAQRQVPEAEIRQMVQWILAGPN